MYRQRHIFVLLHTLRILRFRRLHRLVFHHSRYHVMNLNFLALKVELCRKVAHDQDIVFLVFFPSADALGSLEQRGHPLLRTIARLDNIRNLLVRKRELAWVLEK